MAAAVELVHHVLQLPSLTPPFGRREWATPPRDTAKPVGIVVCGCKAKEPSSHVAVDLCVVRHMSWIVLRP